MGTVLRGRGVRPQNSGEGSWEGVLGGIITKELNLGLNFAPPARKKMFIFKAKKSL